MASSSSDVGEAGRRKLLNLCPGDPLAPNTHAGGGARSGQVEGSKAQGFGAA